MGQVVRKTQLFEKRRTVRDIFGFTNGGGRYRYVLVMPEWSQIRQVMVNLLLNSVDE